MTLDPFIVQLAILFLPGVLWAYVDARFGARPKPTQIEFLARSLIFGLISYAVTYLGYDLNGDTFAIPDIEKASEVNLITAKILRQMGWATLAGALLAVGWLYATRFKVLTRFLQWIGATRTYGDEDVWDYLLNSNDKAAQYVNVRDFGKKLTYSGYVGIFSESEKLRELVLSDAIVYDFDGNPLFETPRVYLSFAAEGAHIEFPYVEQPSVGENDVAPVS